MSRVTDYIIDENVVFEWGKWSLKDQWKKINEEEKKKIDILRSLVKIEYNNL